VFVGVEREVLDQLGFVYPAAHDPCVSFEFSGGPAATTGRPSPKSAEFEQWRHFDLSE
jgi:hypothetical protein